MEQRFFYSTTGNSCQKTREKTENKEQDINPTKNKIINQYLGLKSLQNKKPKCPSKISVNNSQGNMSLPELSYDN